VANELDTMCRNCNWPESAHVQFSERGWPTGRQPCPGLKTCFYPRDSGPLPLQAVSDKPNGGSK
jgi:hypothetical protein